MPYAASAAKSTLAAVARRARAKALVLVAYTAVSALYFGVRLLPHPGRTVLGYGRDPEIFIWSFAWWAHAIGHGLNPFVSRVVYAPDGINLAWATTVPGLAVPFAPLTALAGPGPLLLALGARPIRVLAAEVKPGQNIRPLGSECAAGTVVLAVGTVEDTEDLVDDETLVEEVSIDGMCGVY